MPAIPANRCKTIPQANTMMAALTRESVGRQPGTHRIVCPRQQERQKTATKDALITVLPKTPTTRGTDPVPDTLEEP